MCSYFGDLPDWWLAWEVRKGYNLVTDPHNYAVLDNNK